MNTEEKVQVKIVVTGDREAKAQVKAVKGSFQSDIKAIQKALSDSTGWKGFKTGVKNITDGVTGLSNKLTTLSLVGGTAFAALAKFSIDAASQMEVTQLKYETLLGSADKAAARAKEIFDFAARTPFKTEEISKADIILQGFGIRSVKLLENIGNAAAITNNDFAELSLIMGQLSQSKDLQNIRQLVERGVVSFNELRAAGIKFAKDGSVINSVDQTYGAIVKIIEKKFAGGMEKIADTLPGQISTLQDNFQLAMAKFAKDSGLLEFGKDLISEFNRIVASERFQALVIDVSNGLKKILPDAKAVVKSVGEFIEKIVQFAKDNPQLVETLVKLGGAMVAANLAAKTANLLFGDLFSIILGSGQAAFGGLTGVIGGVVKMITGGGGMSGAVRTLNTDLLALGGKGGGAMIAAAAISALSFEIGRTAVDGGPLEGLVKVIAGETESIKAATEAGEKAIQTYNRMQENIKFLESHGITPTVGVDLNKQAEALRSKEIQTALTGKLTETQATLTAQITNVEKRQVELGNGLRTFGLQTKESTNTIANQLIGVNNNVSGGNNNSNVKLNTVLGQGNSILNKVNPITNMQALISKLAQRATLNPSLHGPAFAAGGIVPGTSYSGDQMMVRTNSDEMILTKQQQAKLFKMLSMGTNKSVNFNGPVNMGGGRPYGQQMNNFMNLLV